MWLTGVALAFWAVDEPVSAGTGVDQLAVIIGGIATAFIGGIVAVTVAMINARANRTAPSPPAPTSSGASTAELVSVHEDIAVLRYRLDDNDEAREIVDRRLDQIERVLDVDNPRWRGGPR